MGWLLQYIVHVVGIIYRNSGSDNGWTDGCNGWIRRIRYTRRIRWICPKIQLLLFLLLLYTLLGVLDHRSDGIKFIYGCYCLCRSNWDGFIYILYLRSGFGYVVYFIWVGGEVGVLDCVDADLFLNIYWLLSEYCI